MMPSRIKNPGSVYAEGFHCVVLTNVGLEDLVCGEISGLVEDHRDISAFVGSGRVDFFSSSFCDLCLFAYKSQLASRVLVFLCGCSGHELDSFKKVVVDFLDGAGSRDFQDFLSGKSFAVRLKKEDGFDDVHAHEWERGVGEIVFKCASGRGAKVDLDSPDVTVLVHVSSAGCVFGIDLAGFDLSKRSYKIFQHTDSIKATVAYSVLRFCGFSGGSVLIDVQTKSGTIPIEAAFFASGRSPRFFEKDRFSFVGFPVFKSHFSEDDFFLKADSLHDFKGKIHAFDDNARNVKAAEKNAKIAGVNKLINFSRTDIEWIDTKFEKLSVDCIISNWQASSRFDDPAGKSKAKLLEDLFYSAAYVLKKDGVLALLARKGSDFSSVASKHGFIVYAVHPVVQGQELLDVILFKRADQVKSSKKKKV